MDAEFKKKILLGLAWGAALVLAGALFWYLSFILQFVNYKDRAFGFEIKYPAKWQMAVAPDPKVAVVFVSPKETALDYFQENVNIAVEEVPAEAATLKSFSDRILGQMTAVFGNIKVEDSAPVEFGGRKGHRVVFSAQKPDKLQMLTVWTIKSGRAYILTYLAVSSRYEGYLPLVDEMIKSFKLQ